MSLLQLQFLISILTLAGVGFLIYRSRRTEKKTMKEFDDLDAAVAAIDTETTALGGRVEEVQKELAAALAANDSPRAEAAAQKLTAIASQLRQMANPTPSGGVKVPSGVIIGGDASGQGDAGGTSSGGVSGSGSTPVNQQPTGQAAASTSGASSGSTGTASGGSDAGAGSIGGTGAGAENTGVVVSDGKTNDVPASDASTSGGEEGSQS